MYVFKLKNIISVLCLVIALFAGWALMFKCFFKSESTVSNRYSTYTVVIDAGHGGIDGGATGTTYNSSEKELNLQIANKVYLIMNLFGVPCTRTRTEDISLNYNPEKTIAKNKSKDLISRLDKVNSQASPIFLSIHMNKFEQSKYKGAQTFYSPNHEIGRALSQSIQKSIISRVDNTNNRVPKKSDSSIFLLKNLKCPAVIIECGFLSNPTEELALRNEDYQKKMSCAIVLGYLEFLFSNN